MPVTKITAPAITSDVSSFVVTASAEQMPSTCSAMGLLLKTGSIRTSFADCFAMDWSFKEAGSYVRKP